MRNISADGTLGVKGQTESFSNIQGLQLCLSGDSNVLKCISFLGIVVVYGRAIRTLCKRRMPPGRDAGL